MRGAISKSGAFNKANELYTESDYIDYVACYNSIVKHILEPNPDYLFDIFCHCWNTDLSDNIINLYKPVKSEFEDNTKYNKEIIELCRNENDFSGISQALTIYKSIRLKEIYETENIMNYDLVILYRYDVLLWKTMDLNQYVNLENQIYVNAHGDCNGDFHFIMNNIDSYNFKYLYDSIKLGNHYILHYWIKNYIINYMKQNIIMDNIIPGVNQEVLRKIMNSSYFQLM